MTIFFDSRINENFEAGLKATGKETAADHYKLYSLDEIISHYFNSIPVANQSLQDTEYYRKENSTRRRDMIKLLAFDVCNGKIGENYGRGATAKAIYNDDFDIVVLATRDMEVNTRPVDDYMDRSQSQSQGNAFESQEGFAGITGSEMQEMYQGDDETKQALPPTLPSGYQVPPDPNYQQQRVLADSYPAVYPDDPKQLTGDLPHRDPRTRGPDAPHLREDKLKSIVALIIVQKGECKKMPDAFAVNLICVKHGAFKGCGTLLMALYLYTILYHPFQPGLLELAGGFYNLDGLCLYSKFGFVHAPNLLGPDCFYDAGNMPMELDFEFDPYGFLDGRHRLDKNAIATKLVNIVVGTDRGHKLPICDIRDEHRQNALKALLEFDRFLIYRGDKKIDAQKFKQLCGRKNETWTFFMCDPNYGPKFYKLIPGLIAGLESGKQLSAEHEGFVMALESGRQKKFNDWLAQTSPNPGGGKKKRNTKKKLNTKRRQTYRRKKI